MSGPGGIGSSRRRQRTERAPGAIDFGTSYELFDKHTITFTVGPVARISEADIQVVSNEAGKPIAVIVPIPLSKGDRFRARNRVSVEG